MQDTNTPTEEQSLLNGMDIPTRKMEAEELAVAFGYNTQSLSLDVINVQDAYVRGYAKCYKTLAQDNKLLKDRVKVLENALQPFADMFGELSESKVRQGGIVYEHNKAKITVADLFAASNLIHKK